ncbi:MAG: bifunctional DNA primase/polymerase [Exiguobacterium sp.]|nr:bifunctional DNA primase/polymerase [Exiguobacterium sp.]
MNKMQQAARKLHALGFATLPIKPGTKEPATAHGVKDATRDDAVTDAFYERNPNHGIGISGDGFVIFDFDVKDGVDGRDQLTGWKLPDTLCQTTPSGGYHMIYRTTDEIRPSVNSEIAVDVRGWHSYVVCDPTPGYCFEDDCEVADADDAVMAFLNHVRPQKKKPQPFKARSGGNRKTREGEGRNEELYHYGCSLQSASRPDEEIEGLMYAYNKGHFDPPLDEVEFNKCVNNVLTNIPKGYSEEVKQQIKNNRGRPRKFNHVKVGDALIENYNACMIDGMPAVQNGKVYELGWRAVNRAIIEVQKDATRANQMEVHHYLRNVAPEIEQSPPQLIAFENGVLNIDTMELLPFTPDMVIPNIIPHEWNVDAKSAAVDQVFENISCGDVGMMLNLTEVIGLAMYRSCKFALCPILLGEGSNGKSTYIDMVRKVLGKPNVSALHPRDIGKRFQAGQLVGKLANLGDDISNEYVDGDACASIKAIAAGNEIYTDVKGGDGFTFSPYCLSVFSANKFPRLADTSYGMMRRLFPMGFHADFKATKADFDVNIIDKVTSEEALEYLCVIGIEGLNRVIAQNGMTENEESKQINRTVKLENSTVLQWVDACEIRPQDVCGRTSNDVHEEYSRWCREHNLKPVGPRGMSATFKSEWHVTLCGMAHFESSGERATKRVFEFDDRLAH